MITLSILEGKINNIIVFFGMCVNGTLSANTISLNAEWKLEGILPDGDQKKSYTAIVHEHEKGDVRL